MDKVRFNEVLSALTRKGVEYVDCQSLRLGDEEVSLLVAAMENSPIPVKSVNLSINNITDVGAASLAKFLETHPVGEVYLSSNQITDEGAAVFVKLFEPAKGHPVLFDIRENVCSDATATRLAFLAKSESLNASVKQALLTQVAQEITFEGLTYMNLDMRLIAYLMTCVQGLESIDFSHTDCGDNGLSAIGEVVKRCTIKRFVARKCAIGTVGVRQFIEASGLSTHPTLEEIDFGENMNITSEIAVKIPSLVFNTNNVIKKWGFEQTSLTPDIRNLVDVECELNNEPRALKDAVVALRTGCASAKAINLQWEKNVEKCIHFLWIHIRDSSVIETLNISNTGVSDADMELLSKALHKNTSLRVIDMANNKVTAAGVAVLLAEIQRCKCGVQEINLANNDLGDDATTAIINAVRANPNIKVLNIDVNPRISQEYVDEIGGFVLVNQCPPALRTLLPAIENDSKDTVAIDLSARETTYNDECVRMICQALMLNTTTTKLNFSNNIIGDIGAVYIADLLATNQTITELNLANNSIGNRGVQRLCDALLLNKRLKVLTLDNNMFNEEGVSGFPTMLRTNNSIAIITMDKTRVSAETAAAIQRACDINREAPETKAVFYRLHDNDATLDVIDLSEGQRQWALDDMSMQTLCAVLAGRSFVKRIKLRGNSISVEGCKHLAAVMASEACGVTQLDLSRNPIGDLGFAELTRFFHVNRKMFDLDVRETGLTDAGCGVAIAGMKVNDVIRAIAIDETLMGDNVNEMNRFIELNGEPLALKHVLLRLEAGEAVGEIDLHGLKEPVFGDSACRLLCGTLLKHHTVHSLDLSQNKMTSKSVPYLTEVIEECPSVTFVNVADNAIDDRGADIIVSCLERAAHIRVVTVKGNPISAGKQDRIAELLAMNVGSQKLKRLLLQHSRGERLDTALDFNGRNTGHALTDEEVQILAQILRDVTEVRALDLGYNNFGDAGCVAIAEVLRMNHTMEALYVDQNPGIAVAAGDALFYALRINPQLHTLNLDGTQVPNTIREDIESLLRINQTSVSDPIDMRAMRIEDVDDDIQFKSTDYYVSKEGVLVEEALEGCKRAELLLLE